MLELKGFVKLEDLTSIHKLYKSDFTIAYDFHYGIAKDVYFFVAGAMVVDAASGKIILDGLGDRLRVRKTLFKIGNTTSHTLNEIIKYSKDQVDKTGLYSSFFGPNQNNYGHFWCDAIPRLVFLRRFKKPITLLHYNTAGPYQQEALKAIQELYPNVDFEFMSRTSIWRLEKYLLPSAVTQKGTFYIPHYALPFVRKIMFHIAGIKDYVEPMS